MGQLTKELKGLATGIGSLPHRDAGGALDLVFQYCPRIPFWPQLPKRNIREGMVAQFSEGIPCLKLTPGGLFFDPSQKEKELETFYERIIAQDTEYFKISESFAQGLPAFCRRLEKKGAGGIAAVKCHITGPFTFAAGIKDELGVALLHDEVFMQAIIKALAMKALWQIKLLEKFNKPVIVFIDEPYLGCFGSAYTPINREDVLRGLGELTGAIKSAHVLTGVHCCGNTDWSIFTDVRGIDIINFDAFGFLDKFVLYAESLKGFLARDGLICWGVVPTQEFTDQDPRFLWDKIMDGINILVNKRLDRDLLMRNLLVSPACGLGTLEENSSEKILKTLAKVSELIQVIPA